MKNIFIKDYWEEEDITFYVHFIGQIAVRQVEVSTNKVLLTTFEKPLNGDAMLYDQELNDLDLNQEDFISEEDFNKILDRYGLIG